MQTGLPWLVFFRRYNSKYSKENSVWAWHLFVFPLFIWMNVNKQQFAEIILNSFFSFDFQNDCWLDINTLSSFSSFVTLSIHNIIANLSYFILLIIISSIGCKGLISLLFYSILFYNLTEVLSYSFCKGVTSPSSLPPSWSDRWMGWSQHRPIWTYECCFTGLNQCELILLKKHVGWMFELTMRIYLGEKEIPSLRPGGGTAPLCLMGADRYEYDHGAWVLERKRERGRGCESEWEGGGGWGEVRGRAIKP